MVPCLPCTTRKLCRPFWTTSQCMSSNCSICRIQTQTNNSPSDCSRSLLCNYHPFYGKVRIQSPKANKDSSNSTAVAHSQHDDYTFHHTSSPYKCHSSSFVSRTTSGFCTACHFVFLWTMSQSNGSMLAIFCSLTVNSLDFTLF